jgi:hypothetical protein
MCLWSAVIRIASHCWVKTSIRAFALPPISDDRPSEDQAAFILAAARNQRLVQVKKAAEPNEIFTSLQVSLPATEARVVPKIKVVCQLLGEIFIMTVKSGHMRNHRIELSNELRSSGHWRIGDETARIGPVGRQAIAQCNDVASRLRKAFNVAGTIMTGMTVPVRISCN